MLPRNVDLMIQRSDLERVETIAAQQGSWFRRVAGLDMLLWAGPPSTSHVTHLIFSGEQVQPDQAEPHPAIRPEWKRFLGPPVCVVSLVDLVRMKLSARRDQDRVHIRSLDAAGLITAKVEKALSHELRWRLRYVREAE